VPTLTASYSGFVLGETPAVLTTPVTLSTYTGDRASTYAIVASGATAANYIITFVNGTLTVSPSAADHLVLLQQPTDTAAGQTISPVLVAVVDQYGNVVTSDNSDSVTLSIGTNPSGGTLSGTLALTVVNGVATFSDLAIDLAGTGYTLHASVGGGCPTRTPTPLTSHSDHDVQGWPGWALSSLPTREPVVSLQRCIVWRVAYAPRSSVAAPLPGAACHAGRWPSPRSRAGGQWRSSPVG
jgi:hypothetical protein